jgi:hypothetical protein
MASIHKEITLDLAPAAAWDAVRDAGAVHRRLAPGLIADTHIDGDVRVCTLADGSVLRELIVDVDDAARRIAYAVVDGPLPTTRHHASMQVLGDGTGSRLVWITDFLPNDIAGPLGELLESAAANIKETLDTAAVGGSR